MIATGSLKPVERIPPIRRMSDHMSVAISTVLHAYQILVLEDRGLIEARPQSGFYVRTFLHQWSFSGHMVPALLPVCPPVGICTSACHMPTVARILQSIPISGCSIDEVSSAHPLLMLEDNEQ